MDSSAVVDLKLKSDVFRDSLDFLPVNVKVSRSLPVRQRRVDPERISNLDLQLGDDFAARNFLSFHSSRFVIVFDEKLNRSFRDVESFRKHLRRPPRMSLHKLQHFLSALQSSCESIANVSFCCELREYFGMTGSKVRSDGDFVEAAIIAKVADQRSVVDLVLMRFDLEEK